MSPDEAHVLTQGHRLAQLRVGAEVATQMHRVWPLLDGSNPDKSPDGWLAVAVPIIAAGRNLSATVARRYMAQMQAVNVGSSSLPPVAVTPLNFDQARTSLIVTGPVSLQKAADRGDDPEEADLVADDRTSAAASRLSLNGGRDLILAVGAAEPRITGWERVTSGNACAFCDEISGDGPFGFDADFPAHDGCGCTAEPIYG